MTEKDFPTFNCCSNCQRVLLNPEYFDDTLYPVNRERTKFNAYCNPIFGGCGRVVYGKSIKNVAVRWNNNETDEFITNDDIQID